MRIPRHIGIIPDGNRRWACEKGMTKEAGYDHGISPGMELYHLCRELGIGEMSFYGFTVDNTKRPSVQRMAFSRACVKAVETLSKEDAQLLVLGNTRSAMFPRELLPYTTRQTFGNGGMKINFLVNYSYEWDLGLDKAGRWKERPRRDGENEQVGQDGQNGSDGQIRQHGQNGQGEQVGPGGDGKSDSRDLRDIRLGSAEVSRIDLIIRWGGMRRLSGFLPIQSVYADIYVVDAYWPDFSVEHVREALRWYAEQDVTLGG